MKKIAENQFFYAVVFFALAFFTCYYLFFWQGGAAATMAHPTRFQGAAVVIDAGHGGEDGGAVSPAGNVESNVNLGIAKRLDNIFGLFGVPVVMLRTRDISLHDSSAETLRQKKVSDLKNRVATINATPNATLISIHQNSYAGSSKYHGAQVFYTAPDLTLPFAQYTQEALRLALDPANGRVATKIPDSVYLMKNITCRAILVECGFLTNPAEDALLQTDGYQTKIAATLAGAYLGYQETTVERDLLNES